MGSRNILYVLDKLRPTLEPMLARKYALCVRQREYFELRFSEFSQARMEFLDPLNNVIAAATFKKLLRLFSELLEVRASRQLLCIHTNFLSLVCLESAQIRLKECSFFRFSS